MLFPPLPFPSLQAAASRATVCAAALLATGCAVVERAGMALLYEPAGRPGAPAQRDLAYGPHPRQRLDLFLPTGKPGWPVAIFVHGGSWTGGDKGLRVGGPDVYGNIGRYLADQGIGVAVINYRLQPEVGWREQVTDVALATRWVHQNIASRGGRSDQLFLFGHSAGAQLAAYTGLNPQALAGTGLPPGTLRGVIAVSGAGLDLMDAGTYALGHRPEYYRSIFDPTKTNPDWQQEGSAVSYIRHSSPPFLVMVGGSEEKAMIRQSNRLHEALVGQGVSSTQIEVRGQSHGRIVLTLSRSDKLAGPAVVDFIQRTIAGR